MKIHAKHCLYLYYKFILRCKAQPLAEANFQQGQVIGKITMKSLFKQAEQRRIKFILNLP
jgi:hypothetical protein